MDPQLTMNNLLDNSVGTYDVGITERMVTVCLIACALWMHRNVINNWASALATHHNGRPRSRNNNNVIRMRAPRAVRIYHPMRVLLACTVTANVTNYRLMAAPTGSSIALITW